MDLPVFHLDYLNNRMLIAIIAVLHVIINHGMAVGGIPLVTWLEAKGLREKDARWDELARKILKIFFITTTTVGALTGVGIWFSAGLVNPYAIGSLLRVFFWTWFVEWTIFVTEVCLILLYYKTWSTWTGPKKAKHVKLGIALSVASWITMALIVSILGFMMDPGAWRSERTLFSGMFNPIYLPQLAFRTPLAAVIAAAFGLAFSPFLTKPASEERRMLVGSLGAWMLAFLPFVALGGAWYAKVVPSAMASQLPVALLTQALARWSSGALAVLAATVGVLVGLGLFARFLPEKLPKPALFVPIFVAVVVLGTFERVREFVRKPYAIADYLYSNGVRKEDYALLKRDGILTHATYTSVRKITPETEQTAGREVFVLACTRCHTVDGVNGSRGILRGMYGVERPWSESAISNYIGTMHVTRPFMPPFPGSEAEQKALGRYLASLQHGGASIRGAQSEGITVIPRADAPAVGSR